MNATEDLKPHHYSDRRTHKRVPFRVPLEYIYTYVASDELESRKMRGLSIDVSRGGVGLMSPIPFNEGENLTLYSRFLKQQPLCGEVRWCERTNETTYLVGVTFN